MLLGCLSPPWDPESARLSRLRIGAGNVYGPSNDVHLQQEDDGESMVVALKMYDPQLHDGVTTAGKADLSRFGPFSNWLCLLSSMGGAMWAFDSGTVDKKNKAARRGVETIRRFLQQ